MTKHTLKTRAARLGLGLIIAGSSTIGLIGADMGAANAAGAVTIEEVSFTPDPGTTLGYGQVLVRGSASVANGDLSIKIWNPSSYEDGVVQTYARTDAAKRFVHSTKLLPKYWCDKQLYVQVYDYALGSLGSNNLKLFRLHCGPRLGYTLSSGGPKFTGRYFTPGAKVDLHWLSPNGKLIESGQATASASGTISGTAKCYNALGVPKASLFAWDRSAMLGSQLMKLDHARCQV